jgi:hypothetical protein
MSCHVMLSVGGDYFEVRGVGPRKCEIRGPTVYNKCIHMQGFEGLQYTNK